MEPNSPELWGRFWETHSLNEQLRYLSDAENSVVWKAIQRQIDIPGKNIIEIGAGSGTYSALMAKRGANATVLDYSDLALQKAKAFFDSQKLKADFINTDALKLPDNLLHKFDVVMSFGLAEHFTDRMPIFAAHVNLLKPGGTAIISVPNKHCPPYRLYKYLAEKLGRWPFGEEYPMSKVELKEICAEIEIKEYKIISSSLINTFAFFYSGFRSIQRATPLDPYLGYALVLIGKVC
jgi:2-polyprenyl-3-methyl-5-hydroxy-6-metoxy-1,4-benzoquinol methylase